MILFALKEIHHPYLADWCPFSDKSFWIQFSSAFATEFQLRGEKRATTISVSRIETGPIFTS